jgi:hypothetical protein
MKLRITQPGFETYNGQMGVLFFENGLSTTDVRPQDAVRIAAQFTAEWEDGSTASVAQSLLDHAHATTHTIPKEQNADQALAQLAADTPAATKPTLGQYTKEGLEAIADKQGIKGLRVIGDALKVKGNSVADLIGDILKAQG